MRRVVRKRVPIKFVQKHFDGRPKKIEKLHRQRPYLNVLLFVFAPCTRQAMEAMVWVETCSSGEELCEPVLAFDNGQKFLQGEHVVATAFAMGVILLVAVITPLVLAKKAQRGQKARDHAFAAGGSHANSRQVDRWFDRIDADKSGSLNKEQMTQLLIKLMGESFGHLALLVYSGKCIIFGVPLSVICCQRNT